MLDILAVQTSQREVFRDDVLAGLAAITKDAAQPLAL